MKPGKYRQKAVVLSRTNYGEADLIVGFFTPEYGKVRGMAKHGRKSRKRFGNVLSSPALVELAFTQVRGRDLVRLEGGDLIRAFDGLGRDVKLLARAGQALELVDAFCAPLDPSPQVFTMLLWALDRLDQGLRPVETSLIFQLKLLVLAGFGPNLEVCSVCRRFPEADRPVGLKPDQGGLVCQECAPGAFPASPGTIKIMSLVQGLAVDRLDRVRVSDQAESEAGSFLMTYIRHILGRDLRSSRFIDQIECPAEK